MERILYGFTAVGLALIAVHLVIRQKRKGDVRGGLIAAVIFGTLGSAGRALGQEMIGETWLNIAKLLWVAGYITMLLTYLAIYKQKNDNSNQL